MYNEKVKKEEKRKQEEINDFMHKIGINAKKVIEILEKNDKN